jgi:Flp pilus assembly protein TadG
MVEFAMVLPVFVLLLFSIIDFGSFYGAQLSVENAARAGVRFAVVQQCVPNGSTCGGTAWSTSATPPAGTVEAAIRSASTEVSIPNVSCLWNGSVVPEYGPNGSSKTTFNFTVPSGSRGCISISYWNTTAATTPTLCAYYSAAAGWVFETGYTSANCVVANDIVQVTVGYQYSMLTPVPAVVSNAFTTTAATTDQLEER